MIKDGDTLHIYPVTPAALRHGDLAVLERSGEQFAIQFVLQGESESHSLRLRNPMHGHEEGDTEHLIGSIAAIERKGRTKKCDARFMRFWHIVYWTARPLILIFLIVRKTLLLFDPRFFVRDPASSVCSVSRKYDDVNELLYYSRLAFDGLDEDEQLVLDQFMRRRGRVLNIGCGAGREAFALAKAGFEVEGIDVAPGMIAEAKRHAQASGTNIHFEVKDATALDCPPSAFDYVLISASVYAHIPSRQMRIDTLRTIRDLLTPNGRLLFSVPYKGNALLPRVSLHDACRRFAKPILKRWIHSEPGDIMMPYVSPVGSPSRLCYFHLFKDADEVLEELSSATLNGFQDEKSGYWIVRPLKEGRHQGPILHEVAT